MNLLTPQRWTRLSIFILLISSAWIWISKAEPGSTTVGQIPVPIKGFLAPDFNLETISGEQIKLSDYRGRPLIINHWATWCPPCREEMPALERVYQEYLDQGLVVMAINATNQEINRANPVKFPTENQLTFPILLDMDGNVANLYQVRSLPTTFFIDRNGVIQEVVVGGPMSDALLRIRVENLLAVQAADLQVR
jgi:peroxiredoxin